MIMCREQFTDSVNQVIIITRPLSYHTVANPAFHGAKVFTFFPIACFPDDGYPELFCCQELGIRGARPKIWSAGVDVLEGDFFIPPLTMILCGGGGKVFFVGGGMMKASFAPAVNNPACRVYLPY